MEINLTQSMRTSLHDSKPNSFIGRYYLETQDIEVIENDFSCLTPIKNAVDVCFFFSSRGWVVTGEVCSTKEDAENSVLERVKRLTSSLKNILLIK